MFGFLGKRAVRRTEATILLDQAMREAIQPVFYAEMDVPDTFDGRYEIATLHIMMIMHTLNKQGAEGQKLAQALFDVFFVRMDRTLREIGVGDLSVPKQMKKMMNGFNGRAQSYRAALVQGDKAALMDALTRNVYGKVEQPDSASVEKLAEYVMLKFNKIEEVRDAA